MDLQSCMQIRVDKRDAYVGSDFVLSLLLSGHMIETFLQQFLIMLSLVKIAEWSCNT